jgi:aerobic carbon-monoxide dehydrogenase medium subunit
MKPAAVDYVRPKSLGEALALAADGGREVQLMAGGQSLVAMMNLRLATPDRVIDIARLPELLAMSEDGAAVTLGAGLTHAAIEDGKVPDPSQGLMPRIAAGIAYRAVRNRGTLGGSLALADPAAEWPAVMAALDAGVLVTGPSGRRRIAARDFAIGVYETRLQKGDIVECVEIPKLSASARWGFVKLARKEGAFASALAVAVKDGGAARVVIGVANGPPIMLTEAARALGRGAADRAAIAADLDRAADRQFDEFQRTLHEAAAMRAISQVLQ